MFIYYNFNFVLQYGTTLPNIQSIAKHFNYTYRPQIDFINGTIHDLKNTIFYDQDIPQENEHYNEMKQNNTSDWQIAKIAAISVATTIIIIIIFIFIFLPRRSHVRDSILLKIKFTFHDSFF